MHCCILTPTTDSNTSTGMIRVTLNMPSATEECREPSGNCQGISRCLESGHPDNYRTRLPSFKQHNLVNIRFIYMKISGNMPNVHN